MCSADNKWSLTGQMPHTNEEGTRHVRLKCLYRMKNSTEQQNLTSTLSRGKFSSTIAYLKKKATHMRSTDWCYIYQCLGWRFWITRNNSKLNTIFNTLINVNKSSAKSRCFNRCPRLPFKYLRGGLNGLKDSCSYFCGKQLLYFMNWLTKILESQNGENDIFWGSCFSIHNINEF